MSIHFETARFRKMESPIRVIESCHAYISTTRRRMHEASIADVQSDMGRIFSFQRKEHQITTFQMFPRDGARPTSQVFGPVGKRHTDTAVAVLYQSAAVESLRCVASVSIGFTHHAECLIRRAAGEGRRRIFYGHMAAPRQGA